MSVEAITLGCRLNFAEGEAMTALAPPNTFIINSCAVTGEAVLQTRQAIRRARRARPDARIVVAGCAAQFDPAAFRAMPKVDDVSTRDFTRPPTIAAGFRQRVRSFVAVQAGCDHRCTFCKIWQARVPSVSLPFAAVRDAAVRELDAGAAKIVLTGVDLTATDGGLGALCERLLASLPSLGRLRLSSLDSLEVGDALVALIAGEPRLMPLFHLSLQAGDDLILKRMRRRHSVRDAITLVARIKQARPEAKIRADLSAGFPTETDDAAIDSLRMLESCDVSAAHVFPLSPRPGTPAARMKQVDAVIVKARAARLRAAAAPRRLRWLEAQIGVAHPVLIENKERGHSGSFAPVFIAGSTNGQQGLATIVGCSPDHLIGKFANGLA